MVVMCPSYPPSPLTAPRPSIWLVPSIRKFPEIYDSLISMEIFPKFFRKFFQTTEFYGNYFQKGELGTQNQTKTNNNQLEKFPMEIYDS